MIYMQSVLGETMADTIGATDPLKTCANILRDSFLNVDYGLNDKFCDATEMKHSWDSTDIPEDIMKFFAALFHFQMPDNQMGEEDDDFDRDGDNEDSNFHNSKGNKVMALLQIMFYIVHNGRKRTPMHIMNGEAIHEACKSSTLIKNFNRFGLSVSYEEIRRYHKDMAALTIKRSE